MTNLAHSLDKDSAKEGIVMVLIDNWTYHSDSAEITGLRRQT